MPHTFFVVAAVLAFFVGDCLSIFFLVAVAVLAAAACLAVAACMAAAKGGVTRFCFLSMIIGRSKL